MLLRLCEWLQHATWITAIDNSVVASVLVEITHYFSFFLLVGTIVILDLRVLGVAGRRQNVTRLANQLFPLTWAGLAFASLSGFIMFAGDATTFYPNSVFHAKMLVILLAVVFSVIVQRNVRKWDKLPAIPRGAKFVAFVSLVLWIGVILAAVEVPHLTYVP
jgi:uncharacterized membrane protein